MKYTDVWEDLTGKMGYWVDMKNPYITYDNRYIESVWWLLNNLYAKGSIYKGFTIQPYSPAAGTGLSTHELNQPGCYRDVKDRTATVMFKLKKDDNWLTLLDKHKISKNDFCEDVFFLAWTTTPWTLPSNTALAVGKDILYSFIDTFHPFNHKRIIVILSSDLVNRYFPLENAYLPFDEYKPGDKKFHGELSNGSQPPHFLRKGRNLQLTKVKFLDLILVI